MEMGIMGRIKKEIIVADAKEARSDYTKTQVVDQV
jgi:hypothetical protein